MNTCAACNSSVVLRSGPNAGALFCHMRKAKRSPDWTCDSFFPDVALPGETIVIDVCLPHHVQVKSGVASQFETKE